MTRSRIERMVDEVRIHDHGKLIVVTVAAVMALLVALTSATGPELAAVQTAAANDVVNPGTDVQLTELPK